MSKKNQTKELTPEETAAAKLAAEEAKKAEGAEAAEVAEVAEGAEEAKGAAGEVEVEFIKSPTGALNLAYSAGAVVKLDKDLAEEAVALGLAIYPKSED